MKPTTSPFLALSIALAAASCAPEADEADTYQVYFLAGQSNMDGYGFAADLPDDLKRVRDDIPIFAGEDIEDGKDGGGEGIWAPLSAGFGAEFSTDGKINSLSDRFGPEITFAHSLAAARPDENIAIIKFSRGGTALVHGVSGYGSWDPNFDEGNQRNLYDQALSAISNAMSATDINGDGKPDRLVPAGIVWMQGEADAFDNQAASTNYDANLAGLMGLFRKTLGRDDLPIVIGRIKDSGDSAETRVMKYSPEVRAAQSRFAASDRCASMVTTSDDFSFIDGWHYKSEDYLALGEGFAEAMIALQTDC